jgi:hypothetical protein
MWPNVLGLEEKLQTMPLPVLREQVRLWSPRSDAV